MRASAQDSTTGFVLELTAEDYGKILPTTSMAHKRLNALSVSGKPHIGSMGVRWEFWGFGHLQLAKEVCQYVMLIVES